MCETQLRRALSKGLCKLRRLVLTTATGVITGQPELYARGIVIVFRPAMVARCSTLEHTQRDGTRTRRRQWMWGVVSRNPTHTGHTAHQDRTNQRRGNARETLLQRNWRPPVTTTERMVWAISMCRYAVAACGWVWPHCIGGSGTAFLGC